MAWRCGACGAQWSPGAPRCPECPSVTHVEVDEVLKISRDGQVTDSAAIGAAPDDGEAQAPEVQEDPGTGEEAPAEPVTEAPEPPHAPVAPPRRPPRSAGA